MLKSCCILSIGSELLEGSVLDTNAFFLTGRLSDMGIKPASVRQIPDDQSVIISSILEAAGKYGIIFTTGGLGPTFDDLTSQCVSLAANVPWERNEKALKHMTDILEKVGVVLNESHMRQANLPKGCDLFENYLGTALGFGISINESYIISMPGVPSEMKGMFDKSVVPFLEKRFKFEKPFKKDVHIVAISESDVDKKIIDEKIPDGVECIINAGKGEVVVKLRGANADNINRFAEKLASTFPKNFIGYNGYSLPFALTDLLRKKAKTLAAAESCTGGFISKTITDIPGSSDIFLGGVVSYANSLKENILSVKHDTIKRFGAVSSETAEEMANGILKITGADYGVSITGIAGPDGGSVGKPVGTVFVCVASKNKYETKKFQLRGDRDEVRTRALNATLYMIIAFIKEEEA